jgi:uncharacterized membrane protein
VGALIELAVLLVLGLPILSLICIAIVNNRLRNRIADLERQVASISRAQQRASRGPDAATDAKAFEAAPADLAPAPSATGFPQAPMAPGLKAAIPPPAFSASAPAPAAASSGDAIFRSASTASGAGAAHGVGSSGRGSQGGSGIPGGGEGLEQVIGTRWMVWAGATILVLGIGFFLKFAFEHEWIGPAARVTLGLLAGVAMLVAGETARRREYGFLSQGLTGGGIGALYLSIYAASNFYHLIEIGAAFVFMALVTATGIALALFQDALPIAILATLGGLLTPLLLSTGQDKAEALFAYLGVLNLGVLGAAFYRKWRSLDILAYAGTMFLYTGWFMSYYRPERMGVALVGLVGFFLLFILIPVLPVIRGRAVAVPEAAVLPLGAGAVTYYYAYRILHETHPSALAGMLVLMAGCHLILAVLLKRDATKERELIGSQLALSVSFLTLAIPARLGLGAISVAWAVEGPVLLWLGYRFSEPLVQVGGCVVLGLALSRVFFVHQPLHKELFRPIVNRAFSTVALVAAGFGTGSAIASKDRESSWSPLLASALGAIGGVLFVLLLTMEISFYGRFAGVATHLALPYRTLTWTLHAALWGVAGLVFLWAGIAKSDSLAGIVGIGWLAFAALAGAVLRPRHMQAPEDPFIMNRLFLAGVFVALCLGFAARLVRGWPSDQEGIGSRLVIILSSAGLVEAWWVSTLESYRYFSTTADTAQAAGVGVWRGQLAVTITWALFAVVLLAAGFIKEHAPLRYAAFALLGLAGVKVVLVDMSQARQIYRIISLIGLGLVMVGVSYVYSRILRSRGGRPA